MRLSKIEKQPFIFGRYDFVTPVMRFRFMPHISSKNGQRISMIAIAGDHLPTCVAAGEKNCESQSCHGPKVASVHWVDPGRRSAVSLPVICAREKQTQRRNHRKNSIDAL